MDLEVEKEFRAIVQKLEETHGEGLDLQAIIFMVGLQELGFGFRKYSKDEKLHVMHVAVCTILEPFGYYEYLERDQDGWLHFENKKPLPPLNNQEQQVFLKRALVDYFTQQ